MNLRASFSDMKDSTREDWQLIGQEFLPFAKGLPDRILEAAILKPFVSDANHWMVQNHSVFQGYHFFHHLGLNREMRDQFTGHSFYGTTVEFWDLYDAPAFDKHAETLPPTEFEPMLRRVFEKPRRSLYRGANPPEQPA
ncbi:hypothetical protein ACHAC9_02845 [Massilia sp. CMS3.1]|uniref:hypothetical protein n=1 Tax=Massilia sp. CMS3.1 TaxID=3373083 RepID=UPI003EE68832